MTTLQPAGQLQVIPSPEQALGYAYLLNFPVEAAKRLESLSPLDAAEILHAQPLNAVLQGWYRLSPGAQDAIFPFLKKDLAVSLLEALEPGVCLLLLSRMDPAVREHHLGLIDKGIARELRAMLEYPEESVGRRMDSQVVAFHRNRTVGETLELLKSRETRTLNHLFLFDDDMRLCGQVKVHKLVFAEDPQVLSSLSVPIRSCLSVLDPVSDAVRMAEQNGEDILPVVDAEYRLCGILDVSDLIGAMKEDIASNIQTMVGASRDERALSPSLFAVRKRLPWLHINLLTAFLAAAVVGAFEDTIARFTALAVLLPIAAGQSGNTGAQALAVTMRGLTLREISRRHWWKVTLKECGAGLINGLAIAVTCGAGVYLWSRSFGLSLVIALAMVVSMTIAGVSGALVPIVLSRLGQDPAQSSSIILTTITDIAGFLSFLGIATLLSGML